MAYTNKTTAIKNIADKDFSSELFDNFRDDKEVVMEAVKNKSDALFDASERLRDDKSFVLEAVKINGFALNCASERLRDDPEVVLEAVKKHGNGLWTASDRLQDDREVVLAAVQNNGRALQFASNRLKDDMEVVLEAVKNGGSIYDASHNIQSICFVKNPELALKTEIKRMEVVKMAEELSTKEPEPVKKKVLKI